MTSVWFDGAEHVPGPHSMGLSMAGGGFLLTHHITVSPKNSYAGTRDFLVREGFEPTLILDPWFGHRGQFLPADRGAYALRHPGGPETNREGKIHIQVEWLCPDMHTDLADAPHFAEMWHDLCVWSHALGVPYVWTFGSALATSRDPHLWKQSGHRGHRNAPGNDHVDSLCASKYPWPTTPKPHTTPPTPAPKPVPEEDTVKLIQAPGDPQVFVTDFITKRHVTNPAERDAILPLLTDRTIHQVPAAVRDAIPTVGGK